LKPHIEIPVFLTPLAFLEIKKKQTKSGFFQPERLGSGKTLSELHFFITNLFCRESMTMQGAQNIAKILLLP